MGLVRAGGVVCLGVVCVHDWGLGCFDWGSAVSPLAATPGSRKAKPHGRCKPHGVFPVGLGVGATLGGRSPLPVRLGHSGGKLPGRVLRRTGGQ